MRKGLLFVVTAPSGCGKGTLRRALLNEHPEIKFCPSITTRQPRPGEIDGVDYTFVSTPDFLRRKDNGEFVEWAEVYGNYYATPREDIEKAIAEGSLVIVEKDVQGARTLRQVYPEGIFIFILPPSMEELRRRIESRGTEKETEMAMRFDSARREIADLSDFDYVIINTDMERAKDRLSAIILGERIAHGDCLCEVQRRSRDDNSNPA
ncbi:MAG: guanylate kinase [Firmicutes bacterium]|nr:guanylate kinase [Candidatus Fermentithermobacillaceae bacterium]HRC53622.1 guanylate kinase [Bacillota bacterium]